MKWKCVAHLEADLRRTLQTFFRHLLSVLYGKMVGWEMDRGPDYHTSGVVILWSMTTQRAEHQVPESMKLAARPRQSRVRYRRFASASFTLSVSSALLNFLQVLRLVPALGRQQIWNLRGLENAGIDCFHQQLPQYLGINRILVSPRGW